MPCLDLAGSLQDAMVGQRCGWLSLNAPGLRRSRAGTTARSSTAQLASPHIEAGDCGVDLVIRGFVVELALESGKPVMKEAQERPEPDAPSCESGKR
jgi:hypothetical protein